MFLGLGLMIAMVVILLFRVEKEIKNKFSIFVILILITSFQNTFGQNNRLNTNNSIGWINAFGTFKVSEKLGIHTEYQWRRDNLITDWQQSLLRVGVNYNLNQRIMFRVGYAWIETYPYGDYPINGLGRDFTEHRIFEMMQLSHKEGIIDFSHRFMLEQRFVGRYTSASETAEDEFPLLNRIRYMIRLQIPLKGTEIKDNTPYVAVYDEIFIGFGENVSQNVFDQNRIGVLLGYRFNKNIRIEGGFLNQTLQFGRQINGQNVFQNNNGLIINANFNFDLTKKLKN
jgi:opacity protein-like surface antigen